MLFLVQNIELFFVTLKKHILEALIMSSLYMRNKHFRFDFDVEVVFKGRIKCTKSELLDQFQKSFTDFNRMARELQKSTEDNNSSLNQLNFRIIKPNSILKGEDNAFLEGLDRPLYCMLYVIQCCSSFSDAVVTKTSQYE